MTTPPYYDEAYEAGGEPRPHYRAALRARTLEREVRYGATGPEAESAREDIQDRPQDFIAQELVELSRHPTLFGGELSPRRIDQRPLIAHDGGEQATVLGGLTRVALGEDSKVVNMAQGGGVKATWTVGG